MAPPRVAEYVQELFKSTDVKVKIIKDKKEFEKDFPLFAAVNRAASCKIENKTQQRNVVDNH